MSIDKIFLSKTIDFNSEYIQFQKRSETEKSKEKINFPQQNLIEIKKQDPREKVKQVIDSLNKFIEPNDTSLKFELHEGLNEYYVTIVNNDTKEVIREIPSKKILDIYAAMTEFLGFVVDKKI